MKYFLDTEFVEGLQERPLMLRSRLGHWMIGKPKPTIDLMSIGIVAEDGREYYAISKDFNLKEAWNRFQMEPDIYNGGMKKVYWLRENVLYPIFWHLYQWSYPAKSEEEYGNLGNFSGWMERKGTGMKEFKKLLQEYGKTNKEIASEIRDFVYLENRDFGGQMVLGKFIPNKYPEPEFYAYYADYDWVVLCWLFGKMMDLPKGFPMYCKDLKQIFDQKEDWLRIPTAKNHMDLKQHTHYPKQDPSKSHNAIEDARWNKALYEFLKQL